MLNLIRSIIKSEELKSNHRQSDKDFIRERILNFPTMILLLLQKGSRSLQLMLNEYVQVQLPEQTVTNSAFSRARQKFRHTAFIEL
jgi:hypothetical protein